MAIFIFTNAMGGNGDYFFALKTARALSSQLRETYGYSDRIFFVTQNEYAITYLVESLHCKEEFGIDLITCQQCNELLERAVTDLFIIGPTFPDDTFTLMPALNKVPANNICLLPEYSGCERKPLPEKFIANNFSGSDRDKVKIIRSGLQLDKNEHGILISKKIFDLTTGKEDTTIAWSGIDESLRDILHPPGTRRLHFQYGAMSCSVYNTANANLQLHASQPVCDTDFISLGNSRSRRETVLNTLIAGYSLHINLKTEPIDGLCMLSDGAYWSDINEIFLTYDTDINRWYISGRNANAEVIEQQEIVADSELGRLLNDKDVKQAQEHRDAILEPALFYLGLSKTKRLEEYGYTRAVLYDLDTKKEKVFYDNNCSDSVTYRLIYASQLDHRTIEILIALAHGIVGITGDQSFGEAISALKLFIYECLLHKKDLLAGYLNSVRSYASDFKAYELACLLQEYHKTEKQWQELGELLANSQVIQALTEIHRRIVMEHDFSGRLMREIATSHIKLFVDQRTDYLSVEADIDPLLFQIIFDREYYAAGRIITKAIEIGQDVQVLQCLTRSCLDGCSLLSKIPADAGIVYEVTRKASCVLFVKNILQELALMELCVPGCDMPPQIKWLKQIDSHSLTDSICTPEIIIGMLLLINRFQSLVPHSETAVRLFDVAALPQLVGKTEFDGANIKLFCRALKFYAERCHALIGDPFFNASFCALSRGLNLDLDQALLAGRPFNEPFVPLPIPFAEFALIGPSVQARGIIHGIYEKWLGERLRYCALQHPQWPGFFYIYDEGGSGLLGRGGWSNVFEAHFCHPDGHTYMPPVAIKVQSGNPSKLLKEMRFFQRVHPADHSYEYAYISDQGTEMNYGICRKLPGVQMDIYLDEHPDISWIDRKKMVDATAAAVAVLHQKRIVHLDLKTKNMHYNPETSEVFILDFGCAEEIGTTIRFPGMNTAKFAIEYMPPQYVSGADIVAEPYLDQYSCVAVFAAILGIPLNVFIETKLTAALDAIEDSEFKEQISASFADTGSLDVTMFCIDTSHPEFNNFIKTFCATEYNYAAVSNDEMPPSVADKMITRMREMAGHVAEANAKTLGISLPNAEHAAVP